MSNPDFTITIHMVASVDGSIAKKDNSVAWFETPDHYEQGIELTHEETSNFLKTIDCYVMGAHTYEHALALSASYGWAYGDTPVMVLSHRHLPVERPNIEICSGSLHKFINEKLQPRYRNVWVVGGAMLAREFIRLKLADEIRLSILPVMLCGGIKLFDDTAVEQALHLKKVTAFKTGMVELWYEIIKAAVLPA